MKKVLCLILCAVMVTAMLFGCNSSKKENSGSNDNVTESDTTPVKEEAGVVTECADIISNAFSERYKDSSPMYSINHIVREGSKTGYFITKENTYSAYDEKSEVVYKQNTAYDPENGTMTDVTAQLGSNSPISYSIFSDSEHVSFFAKDILGDKRYGYTFDEIRYALGAMRKETE